MAPPNYTYATLADAILEVRSKLYNTSPDTSQHFWTDDEIIAYIQESLRTFNALAGFWRSEMVFQLQPGVTWYDLTDPANNSIRPFTVPAISLLQSLEYHLLEPLTPSYPLLWTGSRQFSITDLLSALTRAQNEALSASGCTVTRHIIPAPSAAGRNILPDATLDIRRVVWLPTPGGGGAGPILLRAMALVSKGFGYDNTILRQSDAFAKRAFDIGFTTDPEQPPSNWTQSTSPPPAFEVDAIPPVVGQYEVLTVDSPGNFDAVNPSLLAIPDDWSHVVKWGALEDLLTREAHAKDTLRAMYAAQRFEEGKGLLFAAPATLAVRLNNIPIAIDAVRSGDDFNCEWQSRVQGEPQSVYTIGLNLVGFGPVPDGGTYSPTFSAVQNAPVPVAIGDFIQIDRSLYDSILDYAQHLALFKSGGAEFVSTTTAYQNLLRKASLYNSKLGAMGFFQKQMAELSQLQQERDPQYTAPTPAEVSK